MRQVKIRETGIVSYFYNPLPDTTEAEVFELAGSARDGDPSKKVFTVFKDYAPGTPEYTLWHWEPGEAVEIESELTGLVRTSLEEQGLVEVKDPDNEAEVSAATLTGLQRAHDYYRSNGLPKVDYFRNKRGLNPEEVARARHALDIYYVNDAKATFIEREITELRSMKKATKAKSA